MEDVDFSDDDFVKEYTEKLIKKHTNIREYTDEHELMALTSHERMIVHFYSPAFKKCQLMNETLRKVAVKYPKIRFGLINVQNCPEMCASLKIKILPFLAFFRDGFFVDEVVGFEKFGNSDALKTEMLEKYISECVISKDEPLNDNSV